MKRPTFFLTSCVAGLLALLVSFCSKKSDDTSIPVIDSSMIQKQQHENHQ